ncbi:MAG: hypothetical protein ACTSR7_06935 [Promethearchaeota archaeon]
MSKRQNNLDDILNSKQNKSTGSIDSEEKQLENHYIIMRLQRLQMQNMMN